MAKRRDPEKFLFLKKEPVREQWEISVEICEGKFLGRKLNVYADSEIETRLHRHHQYRIRIKEVFAHHVAVYKTIKEVKNRTNDDLLLLPLKKIREIIEKTF